MRKIYINMLYLIRDLIKSIYHNIDNLKRRIFYIERCEGTAIALSSKIDTNRSGYQLYLSRKSYILKRTTLNTFHGSIKIGENTGIGINTIIIGPVNIGKNTSVAQNCVIVGVNHKFNDIKIPIKNQGFIKKEINIGDDVWIGANSVILPGVKIGRHSVVGSGSVVKNNIPDFSVAVGSPAKILRRWNRENNQWEKIVKS